MKIKLAILDQDKSYLGRLANVLSSKYADKFEVYSFSDLEIAIQNTASSKVDVLIASDIFDIDINQIPGRCAFAYLVDSQDIDEYKSQRTICKYQKVDQIYKQILSLYSENAGSVTGLKLTDEDCRIIIFSSPCGGTGTSTMAAACAVHNAAAGKRTLYLNLERFGSSNAFFAADGQFDMSDIIFVLKSKKANLQMKLESCVRQDKSGVFFFSESKIALDMLELKTDEIIKLISELRLTGAYDCIIIDIEFGLDEDKMKIFAQGHAVVLVSDGSRNANTKLIRAYNALITMEEGKEVTISGRMSYVFNRFSNKTGDAVEIAGLKNIGGAPRYEHADNEQIVAQLSKMAMLKNI